uniref:Uncharacterized protein n=1 Tax=virus sp. ctyg714 TaxID=2825830 RepID=A0A8S5RNB0_9VIRU|nr:MAG TPA: hypothetical protein [virus sp. ctyg714]
MKIYVLGWLGAIKLYPYNAPGSVFIVFYGTLSEGAYNA